MSPHASEIRGLLALLFAGGLLAVPVGATAEPPSREPVRDAGHALRTLVTDFGYIVSSPARMDGGDALTVAGVAGITAVLYANDEAITRAAGRNAEAPVYAPIKRMGYNIESLGLMGRTIPYYAGAMMIGYVAGNRELTVVPAEIIECHMAGGLLRNALKLPIGRRRPFENEGSRSFEFDGGTSFPSGHSSVVYEVATVLSMHVQRWPFTVAAYGLATTVAIQRVDSRNHWASDVFFPAVTGTFLARALVNRHREAAERANGNATLVPGVSPSGLPGVAVRVGF